jgi:hypothetical protein
MASTWSFAVDASSSVEEEMTHVRLEAERLGRVVVGEPIVVQSASPDGATGWWLSVLVERENTAPQDLALTPA